MKPFLYEKRFGRVSGVGKEIEITWDTKDGLDKLIYDDKHFMGGTPSEGDHVCGVFTISVIESTVRAYLGNTRPSISDIAGSETEQ